MGQQHPGEHRHQHDAERGQRVGHVPRGGLRLGHRAHRMPLGGRGRIRVDPRRLRFGAHESTITSATRSTPSEPIAVAATRAPRQTRRSVVQQHRAVHLGSLVRSAAGRRRRATLSTRTSSRSPIRLSARWLTSSSARSATPARRASISAIGCWPASRVAAGAVLVGVAEHADRVQLGGGQEVSAARSSVGLGLPGEPADDVAADPGLRRGGADLSRSEPGTRPGSPNRRIRRSTVGAACWKDRSK